MTHENEKSAFAIRLTEARKNARYTRTALAEATGIPQKSLEKYEYGTMEPNITRLQILADTLGASTTYLIHGEANNDNNEPYNETSVHPSELNSSEEKVPSDIPEKSANSTIEEQESAEKCSEALDGLEDECEVPNHSFIEKLYDQLSLIDNLREDGFAKHQRKTPEIIAEARRIIACLELDELDEVAINRGLEDFQVLAEADITDIDHHATQTKEIMERILDTAILGKDLYGEDYDDLKRFADKHDVDHDGLFRDWYGYEEIVPAVRHKYRNKALSETLRKKVSIL